MNVRAKFVVRSIATDNPGSANNETCTVILTPVTMGKEGEENSRFWKWTPGGEIKLQCVNPAAVTEFAKGGEFYVDFTRAPE